MGFSNNNNYDKRQEAASLVPLLVIGGLSPVQARGLEMHSQPRIREPGDRAGREAPAVPLIRGVTCDSATRCLSFHNYKREYNSVYFTRVWKGLNEILYISLVAHHA